MPDYGNWNSVYWQRMQQLFVEVAGLENLLIDDNITVRAHACAAGAKKGGLNQALDCSHGSFSTKIHLLSDGLGILLELALTNGHTHDVTHLDCSSVDWLSK